MPTIEAIHDEAQLDRLLSEPTEAAVGALQQTAGDVLLLGVAGKMGPSLAQMIRRADEKTGVHRRLIGVSRFSAAGAEQRLRQQGVETIRGNLLDEQFVRRLPDAPNVIYMAGMKFGSSQNASLTWAMNVYVPTLVCRRYPKSRIVVFSTGNVYPLVPVDGRGTKETDPTGPVGEYAMSALGRERMFDHFSRTLHIPTAIIRLNYAVELRYGVLVDIALKVWQEQPVDVSMSRVNVIWQGDANAMTLAALADVSTPPLVLNVAGPEQTRIRTAAEQFGRLMNKRVAFTGVESKTALLSDGSAGRRRYGPPRVDVETMIRWIAHWIMHDGPLLGKPTRFEVRDGQF